MDELTALFRAFGVIVLIIACWILFYLSNIVDTLKEIRDILNKK